MSRGLKIGLIAAGVVVLLAVGSYVALFRMLLSTKVVINQGPAMLPTIEEGQRVTFQRYAPGRSTVHRGDIILLKDPQKPDRLLIKRVIAMEGDVISIRNGVTMFNGQALPEPYVMAQAPCRRDQPDVKVPPGTLWVMGDNRCWSFDSRDMGAIPVEMVQGIASTTLK